jgi:Mce-associated membrane protein
MSEPKRAQGNAPWVVAGVLVLVVALLTIALVHTNSVADDNTAKAGSQYAPTRDQQVAVQAGATEAANLLTFSRKNFETDFARALNGATGSLKKDLAGRKATTLSAMKKGKFDLTAKVVESAFESEQSGKVQLLVTINGANVDDKGQNSAAAPQRLELTMVRSGDKWLASNLVSVGIS